ncbi:alpha/beta-type small acid-soluble spore protein [Paenibacillus daejeonensis]|uniref:alpha/beta-type small acid-soluble spore protein n=1 Tax=Paenibacillus daejeonensis TaxID=135193 RepID=UPI0003727F2F|nr:alpha/beta-type small acid-soluble spore protein [Paenibacillus daejeonensis]
MSNRSNKIVVPASKQALYQMKYEVAAELGLNVGSGYRANAGGTEGLDSEFAGELGSVSHGQSGSQVKESWSHLATRDAGAVGGGITRRLIAQAEDVLRDFR